MQQNGQQNDLSTIVDELFAGGRTSYTLTKGQHKDTEVIFKRARVADLGRITRFFETLVQRLPKDKVDQLLGLVIAAQTANLNAGKSVHDIDLANLQLLEQVMENGSLILNLMAIMFDVLPEFVAPFTSLSEAEYAELELDEGAVVIAGVFAANYSFFTQSLPPILQRVMQGWFGGKLKGQQKIEAAAASR